MRVWLVTIGEPLPVDGGNVRLLRTGMLAQHMISAGDEVIWWNSDFDHHEKRHRHGQDAWITCPDGLKIRLLHGCGYGAHVSLRRLLDHRQIADAFLRYAEDMPVPDAIVAAYPTIELADACRTYAMRRGIPFALDVRDLWPDIFVNAVPAFCRPVARAIITPYDRMARRSLTAATGLIGVTRPFLEWALAKVGRTEREMDAVIPFSYADPSGKDLHVDTEFWRGQGLDPSRHFILCFFGTFGRQFDFETIIDAARKMRDSGTIDVRFVLCGTGDRLTQIQKQSEGLRNILFPGWVDGARIRGLMGFSRVGLAPYLTNENFIGNMPNKPIEYMSAGLPILTCLDGLMARTVRDEGIGMFYKSGDSNAFISHVGRLMADPAIGCAMGERAKNLFNSRYRSDVVMKSYHSYITSLAASKKSRTKGVMA